MAVASSTSATEVTAKEKESKDTKKRSQVVDDVGDNGNKAKRSKCPGVRVVGNRIYDSVNGKTCHQCRQKTMDFSASCKNLKVNKPCTIKFCHTCLLNRYGEKAEEMEMLDDWKCPKCRGICNCSFCMKKKGYNPTGQLVLTAKNAGYSSVLEMMNVKSPDDLGQDEVVEIVSVSPKKMGASNKGSEGVSPRKMGKENSFDGKTDADLNSQKSVTNCSEKKPKKTKREGLKEMCNGSRDEGMPNALKNENARAKPKKVRMPWCTMNLENTELDTDIPMPQGASLASIADIELPPEDVGHALQFLEFCASFGKVLDVKKGHAESLLRELRYGRRGRRAEYSMTVRFHIQLLSLIQKDAGEDFLSSSPTNGRNSWWPALGKCISESQCVLKELHLDCFDRGADEYDNLDFSMKLRILNFLCDEALGTIKLRSWIDDQNSKVVEQEKDAKEKLIAAKEKEKHLKQKLRDEVAKAIIAKNGVPLSISEHDAIILQIKSDTAQAHAEMLDAKGMVSKRRPRFDAIRTEAMFLDVDGRAFWSLKGYTGEKDILLQDMGTWDAVASDEKWFVYGAEQKQAIEQYFYSLRGKRLRIQNVGHTVPSGNNEAKI
ncbi:hypothetical protein FH972_007943 [Carpinus fangiana]|uniref:DDT domain-containing protein n=1 Tax=Carpinus fangiana TaxID=176857 RepID=A0A5N6QZF6_9ROSI|nr:hypothetical protein FH972_007943 [Carpinus fangiana]